MNQTSSEERFEWAVELEKKFPWLAELEPLVAKLVNTLYEKEMAYQGSWQQRGGVGAFMMAARKWDRIENICRISGYDAFATLLSNTGEVSDDFEDLICYLLLIVAEHRRQVKVNSNGS